MGYLSSRYILHTIPHTVLQQVRIFGGDALLHNFRSNLSIDANRGPNCQQQQAHHTMDDEYKDDIKRRKKRGHMSEDEDDDDDDYNNDDYNNKDTTTDDEDDEDDDDDDYINEDKYNDGKPSTRDSLAYVHIHNAHKKKLMHLKKDITGKKMGGRRGVN